MTTQNILAAGVIGLGSMGLGMAQSMVKRGIKVSGFDINSAAVAKFVEAGGSSAASVVEVAKNAHVLLVVVVNAAQTDMVLFGENGAAAAMKKGSVIISSATMAPDDARRLAAKAEALEGDILAKFEKEGVQLRQFGKPMLDAFAKASKEVLAEESAKDPMFKKVYDSMSAFQNKNRKWHDLGYLPRNYK